ncbi:hypothetical protein K432DRAFT_193198 [Lepidopterella palustris CBS 459.81]|uniref:Uncharacterized protein n=1 Tax=Lepidopterella palustris CBS 459.81 TaxID=1314670 RepID=A0A8E2J9U6_9PEZI|nr:hypothetical protein K432DRAFT_193198 [Lepidopterella palustris CBS 459.81]
MDAVMDRRIQNLTTELGQTMQFISNAIATLAAAEPDLQPPNRHPANTHRVTKSRSRNNSDLDTTADTSKSSELSLTRADIDNLYKFHKPPEFSASQFRNFVRELAPDDVRDLVDAMRKDNKETSSRDEQDLFNALQEEDVEHPIDVHGIHYTRKQLSDRLWEVFGTSFAKRKEFFRLLKSIPLEDQAGLVLAIPEDGDSKPVQEQKQMCSALLLGQMRLNWALPRDGREDRTKSKASSCEDPASAPDNTTQRFSKPLSSSEDPTPVPDTTSQKCAVRHFSQSHPVYVIGSAKRKSAEHTKYLADVRKYAESKGVSEDVVKECVKEARGQYKLRREQNKPQRSSSQAPGSRPVKPASETIPQDKTASPSPPSFLVEPNRITGSKKRRGTTITEGDGEAEVQSSTNGIMSDNQSRKKRRRDKNENGELAARSPSSPRQSSPKVPEVLENQASISVTARTPQSVRESIPPISNLHEDTENAARKVAAIGKIGKYRRKRQRRRERKKLSMPNLHSPDNLRDLTCDRTLQAEKRLEINDRETSYEYDTISIPTMLSPTRCSSPELGDATFMAYIDSAKKPSPDHIDSAFDAPTELDDGHENLASRVNNKKGWVGPATQSLNRSRASTPSLLGFDQETGEMRVCQETPPRSSAPSVTESIEFDEDSIHERKPFLTGTPISPIEVPGMVESDPNERSYVKGGVSLKIVPVSPLKALVRRVNEILESGSQNLERLDGKGNILIENALASPLKEQLTRVHDILKTGDQKAQVSNVNILQQNHPQPMDLNPPSLESGAETLHSEIQ